MDNNHTDYVVAHLGDLGQYLPESERRHWKSYNIPPDGTISNVARERWFNAEPTNPESADLLFKHLFDGFNEKMNTEFGWSLFKPLNEGDDHLYKTLRIPTSEEQYEFDEQVLAISKILIESLNERAIKNECSDINDGDKGITKLEKYLHEKSNDNDEIHVHIKFLRNLYDLRSKGVGHRKNRDYAKISKVFNIEEWGRIKAFENILIHANNFIRFLSINILDV